MAVDGLPGTEGIHLVRCARTNVYLVESDEGVMAVDSGPHGYAERIVHALMEMGHRPQDLSLIVLTHAHYDHYGSAAALRARTGASVAAHRADLPFFEKGGLGALPLHTRWLAGLLRPLQKRFFAAPPVAVDRLLGDGDHLGEWQVLYTPGHTSGTISLYSLVRKVLITEAWIVPGLGPAWREWRLPRPFEWFVNVDWRQTAASRRRLAGLDFQTLLCSHSRPQRFGMLARRLRATAG